MNIRAYRRPIRQALPIPFRGIRTGAGTSRLAFMATQLKLRHWS